jgi:hypothetical protein
MKMNTIKSNVEARDRELLAAEMEVVAGGMFGLQALYPAFIKATMGGDCATVTEYNNGKVTSRYTDCSSPEPKP